MNNCYEFRKLNTGVGIFENVTDACIILTCCESNNFKNESSVFEQLKKRNFHSNTYILYNKGYKSCDKGVYIDKPTFDLTHALYTIFNKFSNFDRILVLEDDFEVNEIYFDLLHIKNIEMFVKNNDFDLYSLGSFCFLANYFSIHQRCIEGLSYTQSIIYSKKYMKRFISHYENKNTRIAVDWWYRYDLSFKLYRYYLPLICQRFPMTENRKEGWEGSLFKKKIQQKTIDVLNLENKINPGWILTYHFPFFVQIIFSLYIIRWIIKL